ncbi:MAG: hypothetical protein AAF696_04135 [Bacteroidota bacterium]
MRFTLLLLSFFLICAMLKGQNIETKWYSEHKAKGVNIQNSFPKGGPYPGETTGNYNHSYLVFFTRVVNESEKSLELSVNFPADSFAIPNSPDTYMKIFLPPDTMALEKKVLLSYGFGELESLDQPSSFKRCVNPKEDYLFYAVAFFYQTKAEAWEQERGGNRAEFVLKGQELFFKMSPQIDLLPCGNIIFDK